MRIVVLAFIFMSFSTRSDDSNIRQALATKFGADCFFSLKNYHSQYPIFELASSSPSALSVSFIKLIDSKREVLLHEELKSAKKDYPNAEVQFALPLKNYEFISLKPNGGDIGLNCEDVHDGKLIFKHKNISYYFQFNKLQEEKNPSTFNFNYLFFSSSDQAELDKRIERNKGFNDFLKELSTCAQLKDEACFRKYFYNTKSISDENRNRNFHEILLRGHIQSDPKALAYYNKTRNNEVEGDIDLPKGIEQLVDKNKSNVWKWLAQTFSLKLDGQRYINLNSTNINDPYDRIYVHIKNSPTLISFKRENNKWFIDDIALTEEAESLKTLSR